MDDEHSHARRCLAARSNRVSGASSREEYPTGGIIYFVDPAVCPRFLGRDWQFWAVTAGCTGDEEATTLSLPAGDNSWSLTCLVLFPTPAHVIHDYPVNACARALHGRGLRMNICEQSSDHGGGDPIQAGYRYGRSMSPAPRLASPHPSFALLLCQPAALVVLSLRRTPLGVFLPPAR